MAQKRQNKAYPWLVVSSLILATIYLLTSGESKRQRLSPPESQFTKPTTAEMSPERPDKPKVVAAMPHKAPLRLASWNIRNLSKKRGQDGLDIIGDVIRHFDFISILEIKDEEVVRHLCHLLQQKAHKKYAYELSPEVGRLVTEHYCFLYDTARIKVLVPGKIVPDPGDVFIREPFYATFVCNHFDFTMIAVHILWGTHVGDRRKEIMNMAKVFQAIQAKALQENDVILAGDFNRPPEDDLAFGGLKARPTMVWLFAEPTKTMIGDTNLYDNIWFEQKFVREFSGKKGVIEFDKTIFANDRERALKMVSDHRPVWAEFNSDGPDDD